MTREEIIETVADVRRSPRTKQEWREFSDKVRGAIREEKGVSLLVLWNQWLCNWIDLSITLAPED